jgi:hypothetical protein
MLYTANWTIYRSPYRLFKRNSTISKNISQAKSTKKWSSGTILYTRDRPARALDGLDRCFCEQIKLIFATKVSIAEQWHGSTIHIHRIYCINPRQGLSFEWSRKERHYKPAYYICHEEAFLSKILIVKLVIEVPLVITCFPICVSACHLTCNQSVNMLPKGSTLATCNTSLAQVA